MEEDVQGKRTSTYEKLNISVTTGWILLKFKLFGSNQSVQRYEMKMTSNGRQPPMEDDLTDGQAYNFIGAGAGAFELQIFHWSWSRSFLAPFHFWRARALSFWALTYFWSQSWSSMILEPSKLMQIIAF